MFGQKEFFRKDLAGNLSRVFGKCSITGEEYSCEVPTDGLEKFLAGVHAQVALPGVDAGVREFLISGISPKGWKKAFG